MITRRRFLQVTGKATVAASLGTSGMLKASPAIQTSGPVTLRFLTSACNFPGVVEKAWEDLGIRVVFECADHAQILRRIVTQATSVDLCETGLPHVTRLLRGGKLRGIDKARLKHVGHLVPIFTSGTLNGKPLSSQGDPPHTQVHLAKEFDRTPASATADWLTALPSNYNADTLGVRPDLVDKPVKSWASLLDPAFHGRTALLAMPTIGIIDAAMALEANGEIRYGDKGQMTRKEIDFTISRLTDLKNAGHFRAFWSDFNTSAELMASGEVVIQSMWSPAVTLVRERGIPCSYAPLQEGSRGWANGICLPYSLAGRKLDAAYEFMDWWMSGWIGALLCRQGYYPPVLETTRAFMTPQEWDYWIEGKPAAETIYSSGGIAIHKPGNRRDGGSLATRMGSVAVWNSFMREERYLTRNWMNLLRS